MGVGSGGIGVILGKTGGPDPHFYGVWGQTSALYRDTKSEILLGPPTFQTKVTPLGGGVASSPANYRTFLWEIWGNSRLWNL